MFSVTDTSNWLLDGQLMCGGYPENEDQLRRILKARVDVFICLQDDRQIKEKSLPDYRVMVKNLVETEWEFDQEVSFYKFPIKDGKIAKDVGVFKLCHIILDLVCRGKVIYMHCWGGHGRVGTISSCLLQILTPSEVGGGAAFTGKEALEYNELMHSFREVGSERKTPQTRMQFNQVMKWRLFAPNILIIGDESWFSEGKGGGEGGKGGGEGTEVDGIRLMKEELSRFQNRTTILTTNSDFGKRCQEIVKESFRFKIKGVRYSSKAKVFGMIPDSPFQTKYLIDDNDVWFVLAFCKVQPLCSAPEMSESLKVMIQMCEKKGLYVRLVTG